MNGSIHERAYDLPPDLSPDRLTAAAKAAAAAAEEVPRIVEMLAATIREGQPVGNPYLMLWESVPGQERPDYSRPSPMSYGGFLSDGIIFAAEIRRAAVNAFAWAVPDDPALDLIAAHAPNGVVEVAAGTGYWARQLIDRGIDVAAYDLHPTGCQCGAEAEDDDEGVRWCSGMAKTVRWADVKAAGPEAAALHPDALLLLCWPPYGSPVAAEAARAFHRAGGEVLAYVGEGAGGCTADDDFHRLIGEDPWCSACDHLTWCPGPDAEECNEPRDHDHSPSACHLDALYYYVDGVAIPQWAGLHDGLTIYRRREPATLAAAAPRAALLPAQAVAG